MLKLEHLMEQRQEVISKKIDMLNTDLFQRYDLKKKSLYQINIDQCTCRNLKYLMGDRDYMNRRKIEFERKILDLEQEKRREEASFFRDILFLRKELRESMVEKLEEEQKAALFLKQGEE